MPERPGFNPEAHQEMKQSPEAKQYRDSLAQALKSVRNYDGTEASYDSMMESLISHEEEVEDLGLAEKESIKIQEELAQKKFHPLAKDERSIDAMLEIAQTSEKKKQLIREALMNEKREGLTKIVKQEINGIILPPEQELDTIGSQTDYPETDPVRFEG